MKVDRLSKSFECSLTNNCFTTKHAAQYVVSRANRSAAAVFKINPSNDSVCTDCLHYSYMTISYWA